MTSDAVKRIVAAADTPTGRNKAGHSELYEWYWRHYDELAPSLLPPRTPNWREVAAGFEALLEGGEAVRDGTGKAPSAGVCRRTFAKVAADKQIMARGEVRRRKPRGRTARTTPAPAPAPVSSAPPAPRDMARGGTSIAPDVPDATAAGDWPDLPDPPAEEDEIVPQYAGGPKKWTKGEGDG